MLRARIAMGEGNTAEVRPPRRRKRGEGAAEPAAD
jgi:hypothetical protein